MPQRNDVLADRRFWAALYASAFGQITAEPPEPEAYCALLNVSEKRTIAWRNKFTGWHPGVFDESDGQSDDPAAVSVSLAGGVRGLRIEEVIAIAEAMPRKAWTAVLLLLPVVWLTAGDDVVAARRLAESAWTASKLVSRRSAAGLAELWVKAVDGGRDYKWRRTAAGWICDAHWSTRGKNRKASRALNELIAAAQ
jgi:hypothetical protein